ncbi:GntR family transcriptional regulator [Actinomadura craniellae]|uniref:GntR family transcriptional regulator n=1 Tax=Actinomadura craniellae TaxID=2231787 RepID=A0A365H4P7_9ACTN|nr:GntR family transcriptional regulator [Actinomadura craniellae]RAY14084.1 GntR family transcriptional regulator [Actinomadura craniellae]
MFFRVDPSSPTPLAEQIAGCVRRGLAEGLLQPGDRLPTGRELAGSLGVNMHTVLRAYAALRDEGLVELRRGRGATITGTRPGDRARLTEALRDLVAAARQAGLNADELVQLVRKEYV